MTSQSPPSRDQPTFLWRDSERSIEERVELLLAEMSLDESGFTGVCLSPGEEAEVSFRLDAERIAFTGRDLQRIVEAGDVDILVGRSASDLPCQARVRLTGPTLVVGHKDA